MLKKEINGYTIHVAKVPKTSTTLFVTVKKDVGQNPYHFSLVKIDGEWRIRNPSTVPAFIVEIEQELVREL